MRTIAFCLIALLAVPSLLLADVALPHVFSHHMVLQRGKPIRVWGWADAGEKVSVAIGSNQADTTADAAGNWQLTLAAMPAGGPVEMVITGKNTLKVEDILVGEVWVCSGQSNMEFNLGSAYTSAADVPAANNPEIRLLRVTGWQDDKNDPHFHFTTNESAGASAPRKDIFDTWTPCTPETVLNFSAVAYYFGKRLQAELNVPVGVIQACVGGTRIESWTPRQALAADPRWADMLKALDTAEQAYRAALPARIEQLETWLPLARKALEENTPVPAQPTLPPNPLAVGAGSLYNAKIHPLINFAIRGVIWYQGEANIGEGGLYTQRMKTLIAGWRAAWKEPDLPFYFAQLAPFNYPNPDELPFLWEAQTRTLSLPHTGMAVTNDLAGPDFMRDIHPRNKLDVGNRLALISLAKDYGRRSLIYSGPMYKSMAVEGNRIRVRFDFAANGLASRDGQPLTWFTIAGSDRKFVAAQAAIDGNSVVVWAPGVANPVAVRFAWSNLAQPNLVNKEGLPAPAFRTDAW